MKNSSSNGLKWYYVGRDGTSCGPVSEKEFTDLIERGGVGQSSLIWNKTMRNWLPLNETSWGRLYLKHRATEQIRTAQQPMVKKSPPGKVWNTIFLVTACCLVSGLIGFLIYDHKRKETVIIPEVIVPDIPVNELDSSGPRYFEPIIQSESVENDRARAREAVDWIRVSFRQAHPGLVDLVRAEINQKWNSECGKTLVFGRSRGSLETESTAKYYDIRMLMDFQSLKVRNGDVSLLVRVPKSIECTFAEYVPRPDLSTSWDEFHLIYTVPVPQVGNKDISEIVTIQEENRQALLKLFIIGLETLPPFEIYDN